MRVYTIGHSNRTIESFLRLLKSHEIEVLADVRRFPGSRTHPHFGQDALSRSLEDAGIAYRFLGESLGGRRPQSLTKDESPNLGLTNSSFRNFADYMLTADFRRGVRELLSIARRRKTCIMCSEGWWVRCHRRLIADYLTVHGVEVRHISSGIRADPHEMDELAVSDSGQVRYPAR